jgi:integrase
LVYLSNSCNNHDEKKSFKDITKQDIIDHLDTFRKSILEDPENRWIGTYNFRQMVFNKFFRWLYNPDESDTTKREKPDCMKGVRKLPRKQKTSYNSGNIWDQRENVIFLKYCTLTRDRCFHAMAMDTSCRPHELLGLKIKDIEFSFSDDGKHYALVRIKHGKTGPRTVPLIDSLPYLKEWIQQEHPTSSNSDSWLFVSTGNNHGSQLTYEGLVNRYDYFKKKYFPSLLSDPTIPDPDKSIIRNLLTKPFNPYVLRHSSLTEKSTLLTESVLRSHAGWSADSSMPKVYIHLSDESSKILLEKRGILTKKDKEISTITKTKICVNCQEPNRPDAQWCISCKMVLSYTSYKETIERQNEKDQTIQLLMDKVEKLSKKEHELIELQKEGRISSREQTQRLMELEKRFEALMDLKEKERKSNRDFEHETDPAVKDQKFDQMLTTTRDRIKHQGNLEKTLKEQNK